MMNLLYPTEPSPAPAIDPTHTVAFTGFRPEKMIPTAPAHDLRELRELLADRLNAAIRHLYKQGYTCYLTGMAEGFDLWAAEAVIGLKSELPGLQLGSILPFPGHDRKGSDTYRRILDASDFRYTVCPKSHRGAYLKRNDYLIRHSALLVCYYDGEQPGGTLYTVMHAARQGRMILNLCTTEKGAHYTERIEPELVEAVRRIVW